MAGLVQGDQQVLLGLGRRCKAAGPGPRTQAGHSKYMLLLLMETPCAGTGTPCPCECTIQKEDRKMPRQ